jgi:hypothetical protein
MFRITVKPTEEPNTYEVFVANVKCGSKILSFDPIEKIEFDHQMPSVCYRYGLGVYYQHDVSDVDIEIFTVASDLVDGLLNVI